MDFSAKHNEMLERVRRKAAETLPAGSRLVLFGSRARGEAREDSDWDMHLVVPGTERLGLTAMNDYAMPLEDIGWDYGEMITVLAYSHADWQRRSFLPFYKNVEHDKIIIYQS